MYSAKRSKNTLIKEDWKEQNTGIFKNRLGEFGPRWNSDRGEQGELDTQKKRKTSMKLALLEMLGIEMEKTVFVLN